jgi:uncharacterized protein YndB with AHSA1/START domain
MAQISHLIRINASPEEVYRRVATTEGVSAWLTEASSENYCRDGTLVLQFPDQGVSFAVTELVAPSRVAWHCTTRESPWFGTDICFELVPRGGITIVRFDQLGWPEVSDLFRDCSMSWAYFMESLRLLVETGRGTPEDVTA